VCVKAYKYWFELATDARLHTRKLLSRHFTQPSN